MHYLKLSLSLFSILVYWIANTQPLFPEQKIKVIANNVTLQNAWLGGLDLPQFSSGDIDRDGEEDLLIFDRKGNKTLILLKQADGSYKYAPDLEKFFPDLIRFAIFKDYNCDGLTDIFAYVNTGIKVYKQNIIGGEISFTLASNLLTFDLGGFDVNIYNNNGDIPGVEDIDGDGDIDIGVFYNLGTTLPFYRNLSVENGHGCDSLIFEEYTSCWGAFAESNSANSVNFDVACKGGSNTQTLSGGPKHIGSTILFFDPNEDDVMDILLGDVSYNSMVYLRNNGSSLNAHMSAPLADYTYPSFDTPIDLEIFPAAFYVDVTNDNKKDLLIAPNSTTAHVNTTNVWLYENTGDTSQPFQFVQNNFLVEQTIDLGSYTYPVFFDHNGDGLLDLLVANGYEYQNQGTTQAFIHYYENTGSDTLPEFTLMDEDYVNLASFGTDFLRPTFGDLDGDGDEDMLIGDEHGLIHYYENSAGAGTTASFSLAQLQYFNIDVGNKAHPQLIDLNKDGLLDLVIGREGSYGEIAYYWNYGTANTPAFSIDSSNQALGEIRTNEPGFIQGFSTPLVLPTDSNTLIYTGTESGYIRNYIVNEDSLKYGAFDLFIPAILSSRAGTRTNLSVVDIDNDNVLDFFVGNSRGGVNYYTGAKSADTTIIDTTNISIRNNIDLGLEFNLFPNPTSTNLVIELVENNKNLNLTIFDVLGRQVFTQELHNQHTNVSVATLDKGVYYVKLTNPNGAYFVKSFLKE